MKQPTLFLPGKLEDRDDSLQITLENSSNESFNLQVKPSDKIRTIRKQVHSKTGINQQDIVLIFNNQELQDSRTVGYYGIKNNAKLEYESIN